MSTIEDVGTRPIEREHRQLARQLQRVHQDMDHFIRALSHDMSANFMLLESSFRQLKRTLPETSPAEVTTIVSHVDACLDQSKRFLNDLIHLAKTGSVDMERSRVELAAVVDEVLFEQDELIRQRKIRVDVRRPLPAVWYNRQRLKQIVTNLVRNAIKHGCDPKRPRIEIRATRQTDTVDKDDVYPTIELTVHDNGPGIDPRFAEDVFLPGRRLVGATEDGSGMGLAIVKKIAEHYGGTARVECGQRGGTSLAVVIPGGFAVPVPTPWIAHRAEKQPRPKQAPPTPPRRRHARPGAPHQAH